MKRGRREKLKNFFNPKTIAVIGASNNPEKVGYALMKKLMRFKGKVIPINIKHEKIFGKETYRRVVDFKGKIDLAVIAIPAFAVKSVLENCGKKKIKNVIVISAGFSEIGNKKLEKEIYSTAKKYKINLLGPNCFGIVNPYLDLDTTFANLYIKNGNIAFISQSGALWSYIADISKSSTSKNIGFSGFVSLGNMVDLDFSDFIEYFGKDNKTKKIILYIEKIKNGRKFIEACKILKIKKEIIAVKAGKSEKGKEAAISHTGSLATDYEIYKGAFKQADVKLVDSLSLAFGFKSHMPKIKNKKIAIITNAGGAAALLSDYFSEKNNNIEKIIDLRGTALAEDYKRTLKRLNSKNYDLIIVILTPQIMSEPEETAKVLLNCSFKNKIIAFFLGDKSIKSAKKILEKNKIQCFTRI